MRPIDADALIEFCAERWIPLNIDAVNMQPTIQPEKAQLSQEGTTSDIISRQAAIDALDCINGTEEVLRSLPPVQPELTDDQAITHLQSSGWMQRHDKEMYESGLKEQLADDSDSYDSLLPSAQPERQSGEWIEISSINHTYKCSECGRLLVNITDGKNNVAKHYPYCHCGADMKGEPNE